MKNFENLNLEEFFCYEQGTKMRCLIGFGNYDDAEEYARYHKGAFVANFIERDGEKRKCTGRTYHPLTPTDEWYGDDYTIYEPFYEKDTIKNELNEAIERKPVMDSDTIEEIKNILDKYEELEIAYEHKDDDELIIMRQGFYFDTIKKNTMHWYDGDVTTYDVGIAQPEGLDDWQWEVEHKISKIGKDCKVELCPFCEKEINGEKMYMFDYEGECSGTSVALVYEDGTVFTPRDWLGYMPQSEADVADCAWTSDGVNEAIIMDGMPKDIDL